jgi:hypothetical protein
VLGHGPAEHRHGGPVQKAQTQTVVVMIAPQSPHSPATLAARWREDAQVFRRYGAAGRARMLERMAAELELSAQADQTACVDLSTAAQVSGFTRAHLRARGGQAPHSPAVAEQPTLFNPPPLDQERV